MTTRVDYHSETAGVFLAKAAGYLAEDDLLQASEKGWGAAAQMVKAVAEERGWAHSGHRQLWLAVDRLVEETGEREIRTAFSVASVLHVNFYDGLMTHEGVEDSLALVREFVGRLETLLGGSIRRSQ